MWMPQEYSQAFLMLLISMFCWGSWANALKLMKGCRFELFYWDYVFGTTAVSFLLAFTMGSLGMTGRPFLSDLANASTTSLLYAFAGGVAFNVSNILLTGAIEVAGMAVAFPVGVGLSIIIGVILSYIITPRNDPVLLFGGVALLLGGIVVDAMAYRRHGGAGGKPTATGIILCILSGVGLGLFYPLVAKSLGDPQPPGPYTVGVVFMIGMLASNLIVNTLVMIRPVTGQQPLPLSSYFRMPARWHLLGFILGGALWGLGTVLNFVATGSGLVGPATSFALGDGATMVAAIWGVVVWKEFRGASPEVNRLLTWMFVLFVLGLGAIAVSPIMKII
jgi:glucose uptake protein